MVLDNTIEFLAWALFRIDIIRLIKSKVSLAKNFHIQPSEIDKMPYWEYEYFIDAVNDNIKEENEASEKQEDAYKSKYNANKIMSNAKSSMPKMPSSSSYRAPSMPKMPSMPKI